MTSTLKLQRLNGDTSWLLTLSLPQGGEYTLILDPWLHPSGQTDGHALFSRQTRVVPSLFSSLSALDDSLTNNPATAVAAVTEEEGRRGINAILFSHPFTDHLHPPTLLGDIDLLARVQLVTTPYSTTSLAGLHPRLNRSIELLSNGEPVELAPGLEVRYLCAREWAASPAWKKLHGGILFSFSSSSAADEEGGEKGERHEILYSPHGIAPSSLLHPRNPTTSIRHHRILLHSFDRQTLPLVGLVSAGLPNLAALAEKWRPTLVLATHDEHKQAEGIVARLLCREAASVEDVRLAIEGRGCEADVKALPCGGIVELSL